jgi:competence protein ComEA
VAAHQTDRDLARTRLVHLTAMTAGRDPEPDARGDASGTQPSSSWGTTTGRGWVPSAPDPVPDSLPGPGHGVPSAMADGVPGAVPGWDPVVSAESAGGALRRRALAAAVTAYTAAHGHPLDHPPMDEGPPPRRWATRARVAVAAVVVLTLLCGGVVARALTQVPSQSVPRAVAQSAAGHEPTSAAQGEVPVTTDVPAAVGEASSGTVVVHVVGQVASPGVVTLPAGARLADAITAAGGATAEADLAAVNLARVLVDGEQVVVPRPGEVVPPTSGGQPASGTPGEQLLDLNSADVASLDALPGIGPVLAQRIVDWRTEHGRFTSIDELREVDGIGPAVFEDVRERVGV